MLSDSNNLLRFLAHTTVLILVLMEYALWLLGKVDKDGSCLVLILVLMEYALWHLQLLKERNKAIYVLILVLMEYALWRVVGDTEDGDSVVLILVLMEYALWRKNISCFSK